MAASVETKATVARVEGARWLRCDLHVHTPFDGEKKLFKEDTQAALAALKKEKPEKLAAIADKFVAACRAKQLDLVALTDHNSVEGFETLQLYLEAIRKSDPTAPVVLPGVEVTVGGERPIHFLVIFASKTDPAEIERCIQFLFGHKDRFDPKTKTPRATGASIEEFLDKLYKFCHPPTGERDMSFVLLPAHADNPSGVAKETGVHQPVASSLWDEMKGNLRQWAVSRREWNGFETRSPFKKLPEEFQNLLCAWRMARQGREWDKVPKVERDELRAEKHWALIEASDPHGYDQIGTRFTYLKMEVPDVEGIRLALLDPESRLRRMSDGPPTANHPQILSLRVRGTDFFESVNVPFTAALTTLIGGRGSGKSSIIEYLRFVLRRDLPEDFHDGEEKETQDTVLKLLATKAERDFGESPGTLLPGSEIEVDVRVANRTYRIRRRADHIEVIPDPDSPGAKPTPLEVRSLIAPRVLSQRQIARIAREPGAQRRELDAIVGGEKLTGFVERRRGISNRLMALQARRTLLMQQARDLPARETELRKVDDQIQFLEEGGNRAVFDAYTEFQAERRWVDDILRDVRTEASALEQRRAEIGKANARVPVAPKSTRSTWSQRVVEVLRNRVESATKASDVAIAELRAAETELTALLAGEWASGFENAKREYEALREAMKERGVQMENHERLLQQRSLLRRDVEALRGAASERGDVEAEIRTERTALVALHTERATWRREQANALEEVDADVRLTVEEFRDASGLRDGRDEWTGGTGLQARDWDVLVGYTFAQGGSPVERWEALVAALRADVEATRVAGRSIDSSKSALAGLLGAGAGGLTKNVWNALTKGDRIRLDDMERFVPEDEVSTRVRGPGGEFKPISQGSVGQRSTAVLSLLLFAGEQPLIIDQPEDDLDNQYIYDVVVGLLRKRKFARQIVIATHNANIPVNGDAELIVAFEVRDRLGAVARAGSLDREDVKRTVSEIMEGSKEAFRLRRERYGY